MPPTERGEFSRIGQSEVSLNLRLIRGLHLCDTFIPIGIGEFSAVQTVG